jgi:hypothetical protein
LYSGKRAFKNLPIRLSDARFGGMQGKNPITEFFAFAECFAFTECFAFDSSRVSLRGLSSE